jgi:signal transduction histidine kinase/CheY-like chemotaxis protein/HPt (histidine-containing phosphotransfer) domain-containing protein
MPPAPRPKKEDQRLQELLSYKILDTGIDERFDDITELARQTFKTSIAIVSLVDKNRQWFKSCIGLDAAETPRDYAFCAYTILSEEPLVIENAQKDRRTLDNPLVTGEPHIRFYAGVPLINAAGHALGSLCVIDDKPRSADKEQLDTLKRLGRLVVNQMESHKTAILLEKERKELEGSLRGKNMFFATMSHEIRTPIAAIMGLAEILSNEEYDSPFDSKQAARMVLSNSQYLLEVINNILDIAKAETGNLEIENTNCSLFEVVDDVDSIVALKAREKDLHFSIDFDYPLPNVISSDPTRLKQVLVNLVNNSIKFTDTGSVKMSVRFDASRSLLLFAVSDTGIGMTEEEQEQLFKPFQQANTSITRRFGGTGLGLSISKEIVENFGGKIQVESATNIGTTFQFSIPLPCESSLELVESNPLRRKPTTDYSQRFSGKVLVVEDEPVNQRLIAHLLKKAGFEVETASSGEIGVEKASSGNFDLILMDMHLPGIDGLAATRQLKEKNIQTPIVALTASSNRDSINALLDAGCEEYVPKPFQRGELLDTLRRYFVNQKTPSTGAVASAIAASALPNDNAYAELVVDYANLLPGRVQELETAFLNSNWLEVREHAHRLIGAGLFGFSKVSIIAKLMEEQAERQSKSDCEELLIRLQKETEILRSDFQGKQ